MDIERAHLCVAPDHGDDTYAMNPDTFAEVFLPSAYVMFTNDDGAPGEIYVNATIKGADESIFDGYLDIEAARQFRDDLTRVIDRATNLPLS